MQQKILEFKIAKYLQKQSEGNQQTIFFKIKFLKKNSFQNTIRVLNSLDPDQASCFGTDDLGPNCLQSLSADNISMPSVNSVDVLTSSTTKTHSLSSYSECLLSLNKVTCISTFSGTVQETSPVYGFLIVGSHVCS